MKKKIVMALACVGFCAAFVVFNEVRASESLEEEAVKKGHWTNDCDCKWPGKECNRNTHVEIQ
jgi:hypothetical protein